MAAGAAGTGALRRAEEFVLLTARVLEQRRFAYHFLGGGAGAADAVERALAAYRNEDEGYGHALEPGLRGPQSRPSHVVHALRVLDSIGRCHGQPVERLGRYLTAVSAPDGALPHLVPGRHRHGPQGDLLTTGHAVGLLHRNDVWHPWLFRATDFCWHAVESSAAPTPHEVRAAVAFLDSVPDRTRAEAAADRLGRLVREQGLVVLDPGQLGAGPQAAGAGRAPGEHHLPHHYARVPRSLARAWFTDDEMARSLDFLAADQQRDGGWPVLPAGPAPRQDTERRWSPGAALERLERRPVVTVEALRTLRAYGRPVA
ncbi:hypothetical protein [Streptomyces odontomachi]|uniref:hypothetical protein n=1 Tax=Streptomyces odontomachi TaxID=2944940 RepID=UPI00210CB3CF|nr:hypothetical protein [Streptomyces sp. ODS25]